MPKKQRNPLKRLIKDIKIYTRDLDEMAKEYLGGEDLWDTLPDMETDAGGLLKAIEEALEILYEESEG